MIRALGGATIFAPVGRATLGLGVTQIIGWGTTFLLPSVLGRHIQDELGMPTELVFAGITVMFAVGALLSPRIGRMMDRTGPRLVMACGSVLYALSLLLLALSQGPVVYLCAWAGMGVASTLALNTPSSIALAQVAGPRARQAIAVLAIIGGFASTVFWPLSGALDLMVGWRGTTLIYAAVHLLVCAPIHFLVLPRSAPPQTAKTAAPTASGGVPPEERTRIYRLLNITLSFGAFVFTGFIIHLIEVLRDLGHPPASALFLASLVGPSQVGIRIVELAFGHRYSFMMSAVFGSAALPFGLALMLIDGSNWAIAVVCVVAYGMANGLKAVQRATLPLALFGRGQFGSYMGRLALTQGIMSASAPTVLAAVLDRFGAAGALWLCFAFGTISLIAMILLARRSRAIR
ncbi:Predicted arabinose efflux permease, MFS family [Enhydrobacter aerosaccus]|uniref:Predicted arabinose efflux permease, MFS family n=1 Tax=Enhydrobacter aerosaccus TaxID=225324 RepID=A0A1T4THY9_9HYPH|nr:MFS transporter [Enhydrobacter aerosaccus]SKA40047.1 Predicted arabinose efflux permease, MFS family [Enhydrobacter aerosaccus]